MAEHRCKICGAPIEVENGCAMSTCAQCGNKQTVYQTDDPYIASLFEKAEQFRFEGAFDQALECYNQILITEKENPEAYFGRLLCRYGLTSEKNEETGKWSAVVSTSVSAPCTSDPNYIRTMQYASGEAKEFYQECADKILNLSIQNRKEQKKNKAYSVFLCVNPKNSGSVNLAQSLYSHLIDSCVSVFFDETGALKGPESDLTEQCRNAFEQSPVTVFCGSDATDFHSQEAQSILDDVQKSCHDGNPKSIIPVYQGFAVSELPMSLIHRAPIDYDQPDAISKILKRVNKFSAPMDEDSHEYSTLSVSYSNPAELLRSGFEKLSQKKWEDALKDFDSVIDGDSYNPLAYLGKLLSELNLCEAEQLKDAPAPFDNSPNYQNFIRYADEDLAAKIKGYAESVNARCEAMPQNANTEGENSNPEHPDAENPDPENPEDQNQENPDRYRNPMRSFFTQKNLLISVGCVLLAVLLYFGLRKLVIPEIKYQNANELVNNGQVNEAITVFLQLEDFRDSRERVSQIMHSKEYLRNLDVGESIFLGSYEQDNQTENGTEPIEWIVLSKNEKRIVAISKYLLDSKPFNTNYEPVTWETSSLRKWLNGTFYETVFSSEEQGMITNSVLSTPNNSVYGTAGSKPTIDRVYLLSIEEANVLFSSNEGRIAHSTAYSLGLGGSEIGFWWLRSPGQHSRFAASVKPSGEADPYGYYVNYGDNYVRPVIALNLSDE